MGSRNTELSKQRILQAAEAEFAEKGIYGARVDKIAADAEINKRMLYAYFGDKENLYMVILSRVYRRMENVEREIVDCRHTGKVLIEKIICAYFDFLKSNPTFVNILMWENLNRGYYLRRIEGSRVERGTIQYFVAELENGKKDGIFRESIDSWHTAVSLITTCFANFSNQHTLSKLFHADMTSEEMIEQRKKHTTDMMLAYLCAEQ